MKALTYIEHRKFDTTPLITQRFRLKDEVCNTLENKLYGVIKIAITQN